MMPWSLTGGTVTGARCSPSTVCLSDGLCIQPTSSITKDLIFVLLSGCFFPFSHFIFIHRGLLASLHLGAYHGGGGGWSEFRSPYRNDVVSSGYGHSPSSSSAGADRRLMVKSYGRPAPGTAGFSRPQHHNHHGGGGGYGQMVSGGGGGGAAHGMQLIRESLGSWASGGGGGGDDDRLRESFEDFAHSRDGLRRELTAMAGELSSQWSSHTHA